MNKESNAKLELIKLLDKLDEHDIQQLLAFATGYEAGKLNANSSNKEKWFLMLIYNIIYDCKHDSHIRWNIKFILLNIFFSNH